MRALPWAACNQICQCYWCQECLQLTWIFMAAEFKWAISCSSAACRICFRAYRECNTLRRFMMNDVQHVLTEHQRSPDLGHNDWPLACAPLSPCAAMKQAGAPTFLPRAAA